MSVTTEERLKRRKLDALKRGVHRISGGDSLPIATHIIGIGKAGIAAVVQTLRSLEADAPKIIALAVDIGEQDLAALRSLAADIPSERAEITIVALEMPTREALLEVLGSYREYLSLEYPRMSFNAHYAPWLPADITLPEAGAPVPRAIAKAVYGAAYYAGDRPMEQALRGFAASVDNADAQSVVAVVFSLAGGTGSGIAMDLVRHLSNRIFGHRVLVAGIGIAPCEADITVDMFPLLNELDCLNDEYKNRGIVRSCGELFRNPFTAGFIMLPQQQVWAATRDLVATHQRCDREIATLLTLRGGTNLWELLRLLNWVAAPSTQHSAARTPWGPRWIHILGYADIGGPVTLGSELKARLGLEDSYQPEFIELRVPEGADGLALGASVDAALSPDVPTNVVSGGGVGSMQFILPCISKLELALFEPMHDRYDRTAPADKLLDHSLLLDQGVLLCEPSTMLDGMAGASLWGGTGWIAVSLEDVRGEMSDEPAPALGRAS